MKQLRDMNIRLTEFKAFTYLKNNILFDQTTLKNPYSKPANNEAISAQKSKYGFIKGPEHVHTTFEVITHTVDFDTLEQEWNALARASDTHIFQTFDWNRIWWKHFGTNKKLHLVAVYSGTQLSGIAPFFEDDVYMLGRKVYTCLRLLGSYVSQPAGKPLMGCISYSDYLTCIVRPEHEHIFYKQLLQHFKKVKYDFDEIVLDEVPQESSTYRTLTTQMAIPEHHLSHKIKTASSSPVIQLPSTWDAYLDSLSSKERNKARRYFKRSLEGNKNAFVVDKISHAEELSETLSDLIHMHQQQWNSRGFAGTFAEKSMHDFFIEITGSFYEKGWIELNKATPAGSMGRHVAIDVLMTYKDKVYMMHRGMEEDSSYRKQGPGNVLFYARLNEAIQNNIKVYDMLRGQEEFKMRLATKINQNVKITISPGYRMGRLIPGFVKQWLNLNRNISLEKIQLSLVIRGKSFSEGISAYYHFMHRRIRQKLNN